VTADGLTMYLNSFNAGFTDGDVSRVNPNEHRRRLLDAGAGVPR